MSIPDQLISAVNFVGEDANGNADHSSGSIEFHLLEQLDRSDSLKRKTTPPNEATVIEQDAENYQSKISINNSNHFERKRTTSLSARNNMLHPSEAENDRKPRSKPDRNVDEGAKQTRDVSLNYSLQRECTKGIFERPIIVVPQTPNLKRSTMPPQYPQHLRHTTEQQLGGKQLYYNTQVKVQKTLHASFTRVKKTES
jgi:hypothetical protein